MNVPINAPAVLGLLGDVYAASNAAVQRAAAAEARAAEAEARNADLREQIARLEAEHADCPATDAANDRDAEPPPTKRRRPPRPTPHG